MKKPVSVSPKILRCSSPFTIFLPNTGSIYVQPTRLSPPLPPSGIACGSVKATMAMVYKLAMEAEKTWVRLRGYTAHSPRH